MSWRCYRTTVIAYACWAARETAENDMRRLFVVLGLVLVLIGLAWPWLAKLPIGRLPGDIVIDRPGLKVFLPLTTMLIVSLMVSLLLWLFRR
jgi:hypothetical protein